MWKLKSIKTFLLSLVALLCLASPVFAQEDLSDLKEFQDLANSLSQESYSKEIQQIQYCLSFAEMDGQCAGTDIP